MNANSVNAKTSKYSTFLKHRYYDHSDDEVPANDNQPPCLEPQDSRERMARHSDSNLPFSPKTICPSMPREWNTVCFDCLPPCTQSKSEKWSMLREVRERRLATETVHCVVVVCIQSANCNMIEVMWFGVHFISRLHRRRQSLVDQLKIEWTVHTMMECICLPFNSVSVRWLSRKMSE